MASITGANSSLKTSPEQDINIRWKVATAYYYSQADFFPKGLKKP